MVKLFSKISLFNEQGIKTNTIPESALESQGNEKLLFLMYLHCTNGLMRLPDVSFGKSQG